MVDLTPWPELDLTVPADRRSHIRRENVELLRRLAEDALKSQVEGGRLLISRSYTVLGQATTLAGAAAGGIGLSSGATGTVNGWVGHLSITIGFGMALTVWCLAASLALAIILPRGFSAGAIHPRDMYNLEYLRDEARELNLALIRHFDASICSNRYIIEKMRIQLRYSLICLAAAPAIGVATALLLRVMRYAFL